ncbi:hypothetical protein SteCoe_13974 [Stentor coeruleus]|uniref:Rab-GAP TBC domain-containing protein n=1 Tax=Stentor coeruleus TaxID=5963 RepID=A0A1R2C754_9CILI|nr:hypothetical protein SteCoe_13974 [Stentor coeruleus]
MKNIIKFYCQQMKIQYKQGLNEVLAPFMDLYKQGMPLNITLACFENFVNRILPNIFSDQALYTISGIFHVFKMLCQYLLPEVDQFLRNYRICPEYFLNAWIITALANKIRSIKLVFKLWQALLSNGSREFFVLLCLALMDIKKQEVFEQDSSQALVFLSMICIDTEEVIDLMVERAKVYTTLLPFSITMCLEAFNIYSPDSLIDKIDTLSSFFTFKILPEEFFKNLYPESFDFPKLSLLLIDCRPNSDLKSGYFPNSATFPIESLDDPGKIQDFIFRFEGLKGFSHFVIMGDKEIDEDSAGFRLFSSFYNRNFPFLSIAKGGFELAHEYARGKNLKIKNHITDTCKICLKNKKSFKKLGDFFWPGRKSMARQRLPSHQDQDYSQYKNWI